MSASAADRLVDVCVVEVSGQQVVQFVPSPRVELLSADVARRIGQAIIDCADLADSMKRGAA
ncbi:hypothetical protein [Williamsia serinedens]|uniref:hypothetical protein n=1 Tax=Williamsia serinedens TaxID=391736 RepID=UPI0020A45BE9|nr:hypothetical protein [Williamsia serinedens]